MIWIGLVAGALGIAVVCAGLRGVRVDRAALCRKCRYELAESVNADRPGRCPECGRGTGGVRVGHRRRLRSVITLGVVLLCGVATAGTYAAVTSLVGANTYKPAWLLRAELGSNDANTQTAAVDELVARLKAGEFGDFQALSVADRALDVQADHESKWNPKIGELIDELDGEVGLTKRLRERYARQAIVPRFSVRPVVDHGEPIPVKVEHFEVRLGPVASFKYFIWTDSPLQRLEPEKISFITNWRYNDPELLAEVDLIRPDTQPKFGYVTWPAESDPIGFFPRDSSGSDPRSIELRLVATPREFGKPQTGPELVLLDNYAEARELIAAAAVAQWEVSVPLNAVRRLPAGESSMEPVGTIESGQLSVVMWGLSDRQMMTQIWLTGLPEGMAVACRAVIELPNGKVCYADLVFGADTIDKSSRGGVRRTPGTILLTEEGYGGVTILSTDFVNVRLEPALGDAMLTTDVIGKVFCGTLDLGEVEIQRTPSPRFDLPVAVNGAEQESQSSD